MFMSTLTVTILLAIVADSGSFCRAFRTTSEQVRQIGMITSVSVSGFQLALHFALDTKRSMISEANLFSKTRNMNVSAETIGQC